MLDTEIAEFESGMVCWSRVFTEPDFNYTKEYPDIKIRRPAALADGLSGWGNCYAKADIPKTFGVGMAKIGKVLNISPTPENLGEVFESSTLELALR